MPHNTKTARKVHEGRDLKLFREILDIKQDALAIELGRACPENGEGTWNQQKISLLEQKETIDAPLLQQISAALKIPVEAIQNFDEEQTIYNIACIFSDYAVNNNGGNIQNINPIDEIKKLHEEKIALYERMIKEKDVMMERLEKMIERK